MRYILLLTMLLMAVGKACGQEAMTWQDFVDAVFDDEYAEAQGWTANMEELALLAAHPMDINTATREQMLQLPFLSEEQVEDIQTYIFLHRGMRTLGELMAIPSIDFRTRQFLSLFFRADPSVFAYKDTLTLKYILRHVHHELSSRLDVPLYYRDGYSYAPEDGGYNGSTLYNNLRYRLTDKRHLDLGFQTEKDQGEPFRHNGGWDYYGAYVMIRDVGCLRSAVVGDYKMGFGEGLVVNTGFSTGKNSMMNRPGQGIRAHRSTDEVNFFRGAAATFRVREVEWSAWVSHRQCDATLNTDGTVRTILTSGLHRTNSELERKATLGAVMAGGNLAWKRRGAHLGTTGYFQRFNRELSPGTALYRAIYPQGRSFGVAGLYYGYTHPWFTVAGETAYSSVHGGWATLERVSWKISPRYTLSGSYRFYSYNYYSFHASALSENSDVQNESGATFRLDAKPVDGLQLTAYADFFYNPWPRYSLTHSSSGQECFLSAEYQINRRNKVALRYQLKRKEKSDSMQVHHRMRLQYTRLQGSHWQFQSMLNLHRMRGDGVGYALSQRIRYQKNAGQLSAMLSYFDTPSYDTRVFVYEPTLSQMFRFPSYSGQGLRLSAAARYVVWKRRIFVEVLYGITRYFDRQTQSSGMQQIRSPWKQDVSIQLRLKV